MNDKTCPVCGAAINNNGVRTTVNGREITVCCDACAKKAKESPTQYVGASK